LGNPLLHGKPYSSGSQCDVCIKINSPIIPLLKGYYQIPFL
jgi:hypothetical protein